MCRLCVSGHLQGIRAFRSFSYTVDGNKPYDIVCPNLGYELHISEGACPPNEKGRVTIDTLVDDGDFVFPDGVEPVSAIYVFSVSSKPRKSSTLKIQHCVSLKKANCCKPNFYRAPLTESAPPYHFEIVKGGKFHEDSQYGEIELTEFCAICCCFQSNSSGEFVSDQYNYILCSYIP